MSGRLGVDFANLLPALGDLERITLHHGDESDRAATDVGAVRAETVVDLEGRFGVLITNRVGIATATRDEA